MSIYKTVSFIDDLVCIMTSRHDGWDKEPLELCQELLDVHPRCVSEAVKRVLIEIVRVFDWFLSV